MDTRLRQTPFPIPSLAFLSKNFNDGEHEATDDQLLAPSFGSLGLKHGPETETFDPSPTRHRIQEKQRQRKVFAIILSSLSPFICFALHSFNNLHYLGMIPRTALILFNLSHPLS